MNLFTGKTAISFKGILAALFFFAQLITTAHAHHDHEEGEEPGGAAECVVCLAKSVADDDDAGVVTGATYPAPELSFLSLIAPIAGDAPASSSLGGQPARGPPLN